MEARPPALIDAIVGHLIPPACREHVLGDLCERYTSPIGYLVEAIRTIPLVIAGRIRRTCDALLVLGEAQILLLTFYGAAFGGRSRPQPRLSFLRAWRLPR
jgi:hypothetical protein